MLCDIQTVFLTIVDEQPLNSAAASTLPVGIGDRCTPDGIEGKHVLSEFAVVVWVDNTDAI